MAPTFPLFVAFLGTAAIAPVALFAALHLVAGTERRALGQQIIKWGAVGALAFALIDILFAVIFRFKVTFVGASVAALAGFTVLSVSYALLQRVRARRI